MSGPAPASSDARFPRGRRCGVCQTVFEPGEEVQPCPDCASPHHAECWTENGGCAIYGCPRAPTTLKAEPELPLAHWGQEEKECPRCKERIKIAALRCRFCGEILSERGPQIRISSPISNFGPVLILVFGLLPCAAPFSLLLGIIWTVRKDRWRRLSRSQKILVGAGVGLAALMALFCVVVLFHIFSRPAEDDG